MLAIFIGNLARRTSQWLVECSVSKPHQELHGLSSIITGSTSTVVNFEWRAVPLELEEFQLQLWFAYSQCIWRIIARIEYLFCI
jgi:hypothetical protein